MLAGDLFGEPGDDLLVELHERCIGHRYLADRSDRLGQLRPSDAVVAEQLGSELQQVAVGLFERLGEFLGVELAALEECLSDRVALVDRCADGGGSASAVAEPLAAAASSGRGLRRAMGMSLDQCSRSPEG